MSFIMMTPSFGQESSDVITCEVINQTKSFPKVIKISGLKSDKPSIDIQDAGFMFKDIKAGVVTIGFSNECDNYYELELQQLNSGYLIGQIKGHSSDYMNEMSEKFDGNFTEEFEESSLMVCELK